MIPSSDFMACSALLMLLESQTSLELKLIAQNCVMLSPPNSTCRVTLIESFSYFEIHVKAEVESDVFLKICPVIQNAVLHGIELDFMQNSSIQKGPTSPCILLPGCPYSFFQWPPSTPCC